MHVLNTAGQLTTMRSQILYILVSNLMHRIHINTGDVTMETGQQIIYRTLAPLFGATIVGCGAVALSGACYFAINDI